MELKLHHGRPESMDGRENKEIRVYDLLDEMGIDYMQVDHPRADNMEACRAVDEILDAVICKNLFLCNRQQTDFYLLMIPDGKVFKTKELSKQIGSARLSFAPAEKMVEYLDIEPGSVSVMGLMNDTRNHVRLLVDEDVLASEWVGCHPCVNTASIQLRSEDVFTRFLERVHHDYTSVRLVGEETGTA